MTDEIYEIERAEMRRAVFAAVQEGEERRRRERSLRGKLRRFNLTLHDRRAGYTIADRYTALVEVYGVTLDQAEAWTADRIAERRRRA